MNENEIKHIQAQLNSQSKRKSAQFVRPLTLGLAFFTITCLVLAYLVGPGFWSGLPFGIGISVLIALGMGVLRLKELENYISQIIYEKENLAYKIVGQQEEIQRRIARDIHDAVIGDILAVKRSLSGGTTLSSKETSEELDKISHRLREICHDLSPRDLTDWGLQTVVEDLLERISQRSNIDCVHTCEIDIPELDASVQLHIFRIIQECLNNIEKHANATSITIRTNYNSPWLSITISDNGKGFVTNSVLSPQYDKYGSGIKSILERAELIKSIYPTEIAINSRPGKGTKIELGIKVDN
jgi:signal transduction histidine kinase